ncbi:MAG: GDSL-type esterase/lipase family protein [Alicyclobacillaceae bacterium]|jgi:lysophospholipase L1-like esterase|nr:GDSL-type esterase/lipase family protein [Alicyclobacillaceae bacterium]
MGGLKKKIGGLVGAACATGMLAVAAAPPASAATMPVSPVKTNGQLVALGDSITFGFNLSDTHQNTIPSADAFPALMGKKYHLSVTNFGSPGWTSTDLVANVTTPNFERAVSGASLITLDIGSNDLLHFASHLGLLNPTTIESTYGVTLTSADEQALAAVIARFKDNLVVTLETLRKETSAPIVLYTLYNPFPSGIGVHDVTNQIQTVVDGVIESVGKAFPNVYIAHAHSAFASHQETYVDLYRDDIHPTVLGQQVLASVGEAALAADKQPLPKSHGVAQATEVGYVGQAGGTMSGILGAARTSVGYSMSFPSHDLTKSSTFLFSSEIPSALASVAPKQTKIVSDFAVNFEASVKLTKPYQLTLENSSIQPGDEVYVLSASGATKVNASVTTGKATIVSSTPGDYVVVGPTVAAVPGATKPVTGKPIFMEGGLALLLLALGATFLGLARKRRV